MVDAAIAETAASAPRQRGLQQPLGAAGAGAAAPRSERIKMSFSKFDKKRNFYDTITLYKNENLRLVANYSALREIRAKNPLRLVQNESRNEGKRKNARGIPHFGPKLAYF